MEVKRQKTSHCNPTKQLCEPCENLDKRNPAMGYCVECREYLCQGCTDAHRGGKMSRSHKILCGSDVPANHLPSDDDSTLLTDICTTNIGETLKWAEKIIAEAKRYKGSQKYKDFNEFMAGIGEKLKRAEKIIQDVTEKNTKSRQEAMDEIMKLREEVIAYFDKNQQVLTDEMDKIEENDNKFLQSKSVELAEKHKTLDTVKKDIDSKDDLPNQLFVSATQNKPVLEELDKYADGLTEDCESRRRNYKFKPNQDIEKLLKATKPLGTLVYETGKQPAGRRTTTPTTRDVRTTVSGLSLGTGKVSCKKDDEEINVKTKEDRHGPNITDMVVLSPGKLAITDRYNSTVKLVDVGSRRVTSQLSLSGKPGSLTLLQPGQIAVTLYDNKMIQLVNVNNDNLTAERTFPVSGNCDGIDYNNGKLAVIYVDTSNVEIMDTTGVVQHVIKRNDTNKIRGGDGYVMFTPSCQEVFVTCEDDCVRKLSVSSAVLATYTSSELRDPRGLAVTTGGELMVCGRDSNTVHVVGEDGEVRTLLTKQDGLNFPLSLCLCEDTRMVYVGGFSDEVMCFKL